MTVQMGSTTAVRPTYYTTPGVRVECGVPTLTTSSTQRPLTVTFARPTPQPTTSNPTESQERVSMGCYRTVGGMHQYSGSSPRQSLPLLRPAALLLRPVENPSQPQLFDSQVRGPPGPLISGGPSGGGASPPPPPPPWD